MTLLLFLALPFISAEKPIVFDQQMESKIRAAVYRNEGWTNSPKQDFVSELILPDSILDIYKNHPKEVIQLLLKIAEGGNPKDSSLASGYALSLLKGPSVGVICVEHFDEKTYDTVNKHWKMSARNHWISKINAESKP